MQITCQLTLSFSVSGMDEEERAEYVKIRRREFEGMEKKLAEKQREIQEHLSTNQALQSAMLAASHGDSLAAEEAHKMIERYSFLVFSVFVLRCTMPPP